MPIMECQKWRDVIEMWRNAWKPRYKRIGIGIGEQSLKFNCGKR